MDNIKYKFPSIEEEIKKVRETNTPYLLEFKSTNKKLICLGIKHTSDYSDEQFMIFDNILKNINEGIILVEAEDKNISTKEFLPKEVDYFLDKIPGTNNDVKGIDLNIIGEIAKFSGKYSPSETILLRALVYLNKDDRKINLLESIVEFLGRVCKEEFFSEVYKKSGLNEDSFKVLLEDYIIKTIQKSIIQVKETDNLFPSPLENKHILNKFIREISLDRDAFMLKNLEEKLRVYNSVFYILGKNHIIRQEDIIGQIFSNI